VIVTHYRKDVHVISNENLGGITELHLQKNLFE